MFSFSRFEALAEGCIELHGRQLRVAMVTTEWNAVNEVDVAVARPLCRPREETKNVSIDPRRRGCPRSRKEGLTMDGTGKAPLLVSTPRAEHGSTNLPVGHRATASCGNRPMAVWEVLSTVPSPLYGGRTPAKTLPRDCQTFPRRRHVKSVVSVARALNLTP